MTDIDIDTIRDDALLGMADGPVTPGYGVDPRAVVTELNGMLATAVVGWLRYQQHAAVVAGPGRVEVARCFANHAGHELEHALSLARRIAELGGVVDFDPAKLELRSHTAYRTYHGGDLTGMLRENLLAARIVIQVCHESIRGLGAADPTTRRLMEVLLEGEERHAAELGALLVPSAD